MATRYTRVADWAGLPSRMVAVNGIELKVVEYGEGPLVVLCHGFPELGFSWRHQVFALAEAGYRTLTPDMRGYGGSSRPDDVQAYDLFTIGDDLVGLLDEAGEQDAVFVGHDYGAAVVWNLALARPDRVRGVVGMSVPIGPRSPVPPVEVFRRRMGEDFYMVWFQKPGVADAALAADVSRTLRATSLDGAGGVGPAGERPWLTDEEFEVFVEAFERTGFTAPLNYYRNLDRTWELSEPLAGRTIDRPSMFLTGADDVVATFMRGSGMTTTLTDLRETVAVEGARHWVQQEKPEEVNAALLRFLGGLG